jgi:23S rRNA (uracil1939-C5)-methyltransferase
MGRHKRREPYPIDIENLSHEGRGVGRVNGKTVFVSGALPTEKVRARTVRRRPSFDEAVVVEVLEASPNRVEPKCPHTDVCGGCSLQHLVADRQIEHKESVLFELLDHHAGISPRDRLPALRGPEWGYRRKARLGVKYVPKKGGALVGFREKAAPYIADMEVCEVLHPAVGGRLMDLRCLVNGLSIPDRIPQIEVAAGDETVALVFRHLAPLDDADLALMADFQRRTEIGIYLQPGAEHTIHPLDRETSFLSYRINGLRIEFAAADFTQVNGAINRSMVDLVTNQLAVAPHDHLADLFCGLGNFSLPLARHAGIVLGVDGSMDMIRRARENARLNAIENCTFSCADLADENDVATIDINGFNKLLLDPPRTGADVLLKGLDLGALHRVVYVSCNPLTLARDAKTVVERYGFELVRAGVMDMFPHTAHVESIAVFEKR